MYKLLPAQTKARDGQPGRAPLEVGAAAPPVTSTGSGQLMPEAVQRKMERALGADFSAVRVHQDGRAEAVGARAYAQGADLHFARGEYDPGSERGRSLLGHELAHVVQQAQGRVSPRLQAKGLAIDDDAGLEREADELGERAARGERVAPEGTRIVAGAGGVVQGYFATADFDVAKQTSAMFTTQSAEPTLAEEDEETAKGHAVPFSLRHDIETPELSDVKLLVADDGSMAIHDTGAEPKEFYALPAVIDHGNRALDAVGSAVELDGTAGNAIQVGDETLAMVRPVNRALDRKGHADRFVNMAEDVCIKMAGTVMGAGPIRSGEVVLDRTDGNGTVSQGIHPNGEEDEHITRLAEIMSISNDDATTGDYVGAMNGGHAIDKREVGAQYGKRLGKGELDDQSRLIGVNQHAAPAVGEGYAIYSQKAGEAGKTDYSLGDQPLEGSTIWGYHYAGVVAQSPAGGDRVTLENYNRGPTLEAKVLELSNAILEKFRAELGREAESLRVTDPENPMELKNKIDALFQKVAGKRARDEYSRILSEVNPAERWFFRMYGTKRGQTFHDKQHSGRGDDVVNPLTVRVRKRSEPPRAAALAALARERERYLVQFARAPFTSKYYPLLLAQTRDSIDRELLHEQQQLEAAKDDTQVAVVKAAIPAERCGYYDAFLAKKVEQIRSQAQASDAGPDDPEHADRIARLVEGFRDPVWASR